MSPVRLDVLPQLGSQIKSIRKKRSFGTLRVPINEIFSSTFIPVPVYSLITQVALRTIKFYNLRLEVEAKLSYEQRIPDNPWWKNCSTPQLVNKLSY